MRVKIHPNLIGHISFLLLALSASQIWAADVVISTPNSPCYVNSGSNALTITTTGSILVGCAGTYGIQNTTPNIITDLSNAGTINPSSANRGIYSTGNINSLVNLSTGIINSGNRGFDTSRNSPIPVVGLIDNYGTISGGSVGINNYQSIITNLTNRAGAIISGASGSGIQVEGGLTSTIGTITNLGTINSSAGTGISSSGAITTLNNSGTVQGALFGVSSSGTINAITNAGTINGGTGTGIRNTGAVTTLNNSGTIQGVAFGILNSGTISTITNTGTLGTIANTGSIVNINNSQGAGNVSGPLVLENNLPSNYQITINGLGNYGQLRVVAGFSGSMAFGITAGASILAGQIYSDVLQGFSSLSSVTGTTGAYGSLNYSLVARTAGYWNLVFASSATDIIALGSPYLSANLGTTVNPVFDGGILQVSGAGPITQAFTVTANNGTIDQKGVASTFSGVISDSVSGAPGSITIANTGSGGSVTFSAENIYTGSTTIYSGSTLALSGSGSIATSSGVTNNGTFNTTGKTGNVSVATYTQGSTGTLAMNVSPTNSQKLLVAGATSLAGGLSLTGSAGTYKSGKYSLLTASGVTGTFGSLSSNLNSLTTLGYQLAYDASNVYLIFTPNVADTQQSLVNTASALQNTYTLQNSVLANSFSYDCNEFGANGICVSAGGRNTAVSAANGLNNTSGLLIGAYRPHQHYRVGAYIDQNLSVNNAGSTVNLGNNTPLIGLFGAWNQKLDGTGMEVKVSAAYGQKNTTVTRSVVGTSEAGSGSSQLSSQGAQLTAKYGFGLTEKVIVSPYIGMRYTQNNMGGYTESTSSTVTAPLTYSALNTNATTALAGLGASYRIIPSVTTFASAGVETDTNTANGTYSATGIAGLTSINFNANPVKTRPTATLGAYYDVVKSQRVGITGIYRQEPFQAVTTTTVMATYTVGL